MAKPQRVCERPLLMNRLMVRATLEDRKTMTRRVVKSFKHFVQSEGRELDCIKDKDGLPSRLDMAPDNWDCCPYGQPGDRLWVKERHCFLDVSKSSEPKRWNLVIEFSDGSERDTYCYGKKPKQTRERGDTAWRPSIHMPRWASRITLEITGVRVERLQDMHHKTNEFLAEGIMLSPSELFPDVNTADKLEREFIKLWDSINAKRAPWASNPWVWVVEFKRGII